MHNHLGNERIEYDSFQRKYRLKIIGNRITFPGVDVGGKITAKTTIEDGKAAIFHIAGHNGWSGQGETTYYPPHLMIGLVDIKEGIFHDHLTIHYTRKYRQEAYQKAQELCYSLDNPTIL